MRPARLLTPALLLCGIAAGSAGAAPVVGPLHESTVPVPVPAGLRSVVVDVEAGDITVSAGTAKGSVHKSWDLQEPTLTTSYKAGVLTLKGRCTENSVDVAGVVYVGSPAQSCRVDLTLALPASVPVQLLGDRVTVTGRSGAVRVRGLSAVTLDKLGPGAVDAASDVSSLALRSSHPVSALLRANNSVTVSDLTTKALGAVSESGSVSLTRVTAQDLSASANGGVSVSTAQARTATLRSSSSTVSVDDVRLAGALLAEANNGVSARHLRASSASLSSSSSTVSVTDTVLSGALTAHGNDGVTAARVQAATATLTSDSASVSVTDTTVAGVLTARSNNAASAERLRAAGATLTSASSTVTVTDSTLRQALTADAVNAVRVTGTRVPVADLRSSSSTLQVRGSTITDLVGQANNAVDVQLPAAPTHVRLDSATSTLALEVPRDSYAVTARSANGQVTVRGIVSDAQAKRVLELSANGDVTVN